MNKSNLKLPTFNREETRAIVGISLSLGLRMLGLSMIVPIFALFAHQLPGSTPFLTGIAMGAYGLTQIFIMVPIGKISDQLGRKPVMIFCLLVFCLANILSAISQHIFTLILARLLQGIGSTASVAYAWVADSIRADRRNRGLAYIGTGIGIGLTIGLTIGSIIAGSWGFRSVFWLCAFLTLIATFYLSFFVKEPLQRRYHQDIEFDTSQFKAVLGNRNLRLLYISGFLCYSTLCEMFYIIPLTLNKFLLPSEFWLIFFPLSFAGIVTMIISSRIADRGHARLALTIGYIEIIISALLFWASNSPHLIFLAILAYYIGFSSLEPILATAVIKFARQDLRGTTGGTYTMFQSIGTFFGGASAGALYHIHPNLVFTEIALLALLGTATVSFLQLN